MGINDLKAEVEQMGVTIKKTMYCAYCGIPMVEISYGKHRCPSCNQMYEQEQ